MTDGATSTNANGFFGANLKYSGYDAIVIQGQAKKLVVPLHQRRRGRAARRRPPPRQGHVGDAAGARGGARAHRPPHVRVRDRRRPARTCVRFAAIHGDYGHVASKNGCGAVMGKKKLKAVCIVRGTKAPRARTTRAGSSRPPTTSPTISRPIPSTSTLYNYGTLPGVPNLYKLGVLPIKNYTTNVTDGGHDGVGAGQAARGLRPPRAPVQRLRHAPLPHPGDPQGPAQGRARGRAGVRGLVGRGLDDRPHRQGRHHLAQHALDRACVDVNEFGWVCGWVMECMEKG